MDAMKEGYGPNFMKLLQDSNAYAVSSRAEIRRRRMDLSWNVPGDTAEIEKLAGQSRWLRTLAVRVRPGHGQSYEDSMKGVKAGFEKSPARPIVLASQLAAGQPGVTYYFSLFLKALGDLDTQAGAPLRELMDSEAFAKYQKSGADDVISSEWTISRIPPELSNPPEGIANADTAFWRPAPKKSGAKTGEGKDAVGRLDQSRISQPALCRSLFGTKRRRSRTWCSQFPALTFAGFQFQNTMRITAAHGPEEQRSP